MAIDRGIVSLMIITAFCIITVFKVSRLATPDIILKSVKEVLSQKGRFHLVTVSY